jgi:uncharacterized protein
VKLLADTGALLALFNPQDQFHRQATRFVRRARDTRFVVTELIVSETVTRLRSRLDADRAADVGTALVRSRRYEVLFVDISLADAVSFAVIRDLALDGAFTFDRDFRDCGFVTHPALDAS